jgi:hypothetical protein
VPSLSPEQRRSRAVTAQQLLDNEVLQSAFYALTADLLRQIDQVKLDDKDGHTRLVMALQMSKAIERQLWLLVQDGHEAVQQINLRGKRID